MEILPKVETDKVTKEHIFSLVSSLAKKGFLFVDCNKLNVGIITLDGKVEMPVIIGDGCVVKMDREGLDNNYYYNCKTFKGHKVKDNLHLFYLTMIDFFS